MVKFIINSEHLKSLINLMNIFSEDCALYFYPDRVSMNQIDQSHTSMIFADIDVKAFKSYECKADEVVVFNLKKWNVIIKALNGDVSVETSDKTTVKCGKSTYTITQIDPDPYKQVKIPDIPFEVHFSMNCSELKKSADVCSDFSDMIRFKTTDDGFNMVAVSSDKNSSSIVHEKSTLKVIGDWNNTSSALGYSYLQCLLKVIKVDVIDIEFATDMPIQLSFKYMEGNMDVRYMIAPRIGDEEDD